MMNLMTVVIVLLYCDDTRRLLRRMEWNGG